MELNVKQELYPTLNDEFIRECVEIIKKNKKNWADPFFMDVYTNSELDNYKKVIDKLENKSKIENIIILGTGGSIQTMLALEGLLSKKLFPIVSSRPAEIRDVFEKCEIGNSIVIPISRGGKTLDVNSTIELFKDFPMIGLSSRGPMNDYLKSLNVPILPVPDLSGRFAASVCSVALVPSIIGGIDVDDFLKHLDDSYKIFGDLDIGKKNFALELACFLYAVYKKGFRNIFSMPYSSYLEGSVGLFVQELSESSGKQGDKGLLGTSQAAPLAQHSVLELLLGGSKGHSVPLIWTTESEPYDVEINNAEFEINNETALTIINYQADATFQALLEQGLPAGKISINNISNKSFSQLIALIQSAVYYFCMLLNVNWESNPLVVTGKEICNEAMKEKKTIEDRIATRKTIASEKLKDFLKF